MALQDLLETRTLIATINHENLDVPKMFFINEFFGEPVSTEEDTVDIYRIVGDKGLASFRHSGQESKVVGDKGNEYIGTYKYPYIAEKMIIEARDLRKLQEASSIYRTQPKTLAEKEQELVDRYIRRLRTRIDRREEWMASKMLQTGIVTYSNDSVAFKIDLQIDSTYLPVLSGTSRWGQSAADIPGNLETWTAAINSATGGFGGRVILGSTAATLFKRDEIVREDLKAINVRAGAIVLNGTQTEGARDLGNYNGFTFETYQETYLADDGSTQNFFPANGVLLMGSTFQGHRLFGLNEALGKSYGDPYFADSNPEWDPDVQWLRGKARPLPIPEEEGSWVFATVA